MANETMQDASIKAQVPCDTGSAVNATPNRDPWAHRSVGMRCDGCMWWVIKGAGPLGRCRRHAPTMSGYPACFAHDWCGDHKLDEQKL